MSASAFDIATSGMAAHRAEMDIIAQNLANAGTVRAGGGSATRAREPVFASDEGSSFAAALQDASFDFADVSDVSNGASDGPSGVRIAGVIETSEINPIEQMVSLVAAGRAFDADVAALQAAKQMDVEAIDVDRA